jgi:nucleotide-binding universal stress UspA family protein
VIDEIGTSLEDVAKQAAGANLLVTAYRHERSLTALFLGQPLMRLMRLCPCPVLVAKTRPRKRYARVLVAVDFRAEMLDIAKFACALDRDAQVELFHAVSTVGEGRLKQADVADHVIKTYRNTSLQRACERMSSLRGALGEQGGRLASTIVHGDAAHKAVARQEYSGAGLLVVGSQRNGAALVDRVLPGTAQRAVRLASSDVLVVPYDFGGARERAALPRTGAAYKPARSELMQTRRTAS